MIDDFIRKRCLESAANFSRLGDLAPVIGQAAERIKQSVDAGGKAIFCGNGGSAADSQHLATELMGRFLRERAPVAALALTVNASTLTAIGNDYGFEHVFSRQLAGIGRAGDVLVGISTSGNSDNVVHAAQKAREMGIAVVALTGEDGGRLGRQCDLLINVPATRVDLIQEMHIAVGHILCAIVEGE